MQIKDLSGYIIHEVEDSDLNQKSVESLNLREANFEGAVLRGVSFRGSDLTGASFNEADLSSTDFQNANLTGATFIRANLSNTNFWEANIKEVNFFASNLWTSYGFSFTHKKGSRDSLLYTEFKHQQQLQIGHREVHSLRGWLENYNIIFKKHDYFEQEIEEYYGYIKEFIR